MYRLRTAYGVASQFIVSCPSSNPTLNAVQAYPPGLVITNKDAPAAPLFPRRTLYLAPGAGYNGAESTVNAAFLYGFNTTIVSYDPSSQTAVLPSDIAGQSYVVLTTASNGETVDASNSLTNPQAFYVDVPASMFDQTAHGTKMY